MKYILITLPYVIAVLITVFITIRMHRQGKINRVITATTGQFIFWSANIHILFGLIQKSITPGELMVTLIIAMLGAVIFAFFGIHRNSETTRGL